MKENSNKALITNSTILYLNLAITSICGFMTTRFALQALGVVDYGLFSVIGGIIAIISIINTIMVSTSNRFIAISIGKNDTQETNNIFNICLKIHFKIALITALIAYPLGIWYIYEILNYDGDIQNAIYIYIISTTASIISFAIVPYHGLLTAKERFKVFCIPSAISHIAKLIFAYVLVSHFENKLILYSVFIAITTLYPCIIYIMYCRKHFRNIVKWKRIEDKEKTKEIISFSGWVGYGAIAYIGRNQGAAILVNSFFNTIMNTAFGIANSINAIVGMFAKTITQPIEPQITKSYAAGNKERCDNLLVFSTKITYILVLFIACPFFLECEWVLSLWLGDVPPFATTFTILIIIDTLIESLNSGIKSIIFASGKIKLFQVIPSTIKIVAIVAAYFVLDNGNASYSLLYVYICSSIIIVIINQWILHKSFDYNLIKMLKQSYLPSISITILFLPLIFIELNYHPIINILIGFAYLLILILLIGITHKEKSYILSLITKSKK